MPEFEVEVELRYAAGAAALETLALATRLGTAELGDVVENDEEDRYLDTRDGRLAQAAWACRLRTRRVGGAATVVVSLKGPAESVVGALHRRPEVEGPASASLEPAAWPPSAARDQLELLRAGQPLTTRLTLRQRRRERSVAVDDHHVALLSLDEVEVVDADPSTGMRVVELEQATGASDDDFAMVGRGLAAIDGLVPDARSKLERAIAILGDAQVAR